MSEDWRTLGRDDVVNTMSRRVFRFKAGNSDVWELREDVMEV